MGDSVVLGPDEPEAFCILDVTPSRPALLVCDHASNRIPAGLHQLGVSERALASHLGVDIGAAEATRYLSDALQLPAVMAAYSRLVVDCNRRLDDPTAFSKGTGDNRVPGNLSLAHADREARANAIYWPYHHAIRDRLAALEPLGQAPALIAIHSFTPELHAGPRPWHFGVLWDSDPRMPAPLIKNLRANPDLMVGDNEPYSGKDLHDFTIDHHGEAEGLPHVSIEIRQDLVETAEGVRHWAGLLAEALAPILDDEQLYTFWTT
jgi:predicted N-formylglutamate amidohydrolase